MIVRPRLFSVAGLGTRTNRQVSGPSVVRSRSSAALPTPSAGVRSIAFPMSQFLPAPDGPVTMIPPDSPLR